MLEEVGVEGTRGGREMVELETESSSRRSGISSTPAIPSSCTSSSVISITTLDLPSPSSKSNEAAASLSLDASGTSGINSRPPAIPVPSELSESDELPRERDPGIPIGRAPAGGGINTGGE